MGTNSGRADGAEYPPVIGLDDVPALLRAAFDAARTAGKVEWRRMTTAVLKNRLLQMTARRFDEKTLGYSSMAELLAQFPDLVQLDHTTRPTTVEFVAEEPLDQTTRIESEATTNLRGRVRPDLWTALLDYSAGHDWVWDAAIGRAREAEPGDDDGRVLPTIDRDELADLRSRFAGEVANGLDADDTDRVERWAARGLGTTALPVSLQGSWNEKLKTTVLERLAQWFDLKGLTLPGDLVSAAAARASREIDDELTRLRTLVIDCVQSMTFSELAALDLPAGAVLRARGRRQRGL